MSYFQVGLLQIVSSSSSYSSPVSTYISVSILETENRYLVINIYGIWLVALNNFPFSFCMYVNVKCLCLFVMYDVCGQTWIERLEDKEAR